MSIVIETFLVCDKCGENFGIDNRHQSGAAHRANAEQSGWILKGNKDICPNCQKNKTRSINHETPDQ